MVKRLKARQHKILRVEREVDKIFAENFTYSFDSILCYIAAAPVYNSKLTGDINMAFKPIYKNISDMSNEELLERDFHIELKKAMVESCGKGDRKRQGYIMGALREVLKKYSVEIKKDE